MTMMLNGKEMNLDVLAWRMKGMRQEEQEEILGGLEAQQMADAQIRCNNETNPERKEMMEMMLLTGRFNFDTIFGS